MKYALTFAVGWAIYQVEISLKKSISPEQEEFNKKGMIIFMLIKQILAVGLMFYGINRVLQQLLHGG